MLGKSLLPLAFAVAFASAGIDPLWAMPFDPHVSAVAAPVYQIENVRRGGGGFRGGHSFHGRGSVAHRGYGFRGGGMHVRHGVVAGGRYRVGGRYHGGIWYGARGRYWGGRYWAYGVGRCWRGTPEGYVWICG